MLAVRFLPLVFKQLSRRPVRSALTAGGVAIAMFLFVAVQSLQEGVAGATRAAASDTTLVVYRANRFCPAASRLPESYQSRIARMPGVASVVPLRIVVNNCRASLDVVTFRGLPPSSLEGPGGMSTAWRLVAGSFDRWKARSDAAIVGSTLALRRGFKVGDSFDASGITVSVAGIIESDQPQDRNVAYVHLDFLQQASTKGGGLGVVTQFNVRVGDPSRLEEVAAAIDREFERDQDPTATRPEKAFVAQAGADIVEIVGFTRWVGWGCLVAVLALVSNAVVLGVQDRVREHAVLQTLGFRTWLIARLILGEGLVLSLLGATIGGLGAAALVRWGHLSISQEGLSIIVDASWTSVATGLVLAGGAGVLAGLVPAWQASRREITACLRAV